MKRLLILFLTLILILTPLGCASSQSTTQPNKVTYATTAAATAAKSGGAETADFSTDGQSGQSIQRKVVRNASMSLETKDVAAAYKDILDYAAVRGGYEASRSQRTVNGLTIIDAQIKIKPDELDGLMAFVAKQGGINSTQTSTSDITESYYDAQTRLVTMEKSLITYYDFLSKAKNITESLAVQQEINQLTREIESLKGKLKLWDTMLAESTLSLSIQQISDPVKIKKEINWSTLTFEDMGYLMKSGLTGLLNFIANVLQWAAIALVVSLPIWLPALIVILVIHRRKQKRRDELKRVLEAQQAESAEQTEPTEKPES